MIVNHNMGSLNTLNSLNANNTTMMKSLAKLSSGLRINSAADDAAGLAISEKMRGQISGLDMASTNAENGISLLETAEGALDETTSILQRMRELAVESASDTLTDEDRTDIQSEFTELIDEIDRIATTTQFNTKNLLDGSMSAATAAVANVSTNSSMATALSCSADTITSTFAASLEDTSLEISSNSAFTNTTTITSTTTFTLTVDGEDYAIEVAAPGTATTTAYVASVETAINTALASAGVTVNLDISTAGTVSLSVASATATVSTVSIAGADELGFTSTTSITSAISGSSTLAEMAKINSNITFDSSGNSVFTVGSTTVTLSSTSTVTTLLASVNAALGTTAAIAFDDSTDTFTVTSSTTGSTSSIATISDSGGTLISSLLTTAGGATVSEGLDAGQISLSGTLLTNLSDTGTNSLGITCGDTLSVNYVQNGAMCEKTLTVTATTTLADVNTLLNSVATISVGANNELSVTADTAGSEGAIYGLTVTVADSEGEENATASNALSEWTQTKAATDQRANGSSTILIGANTGQTFNISINSMDASSLGVEGLSVSSFDEANIAISVIDTATSMVSAERGKMGAEENRLEHTILNLTTSSENITSAESRIRDVDMAAEMANYTKLSVINQAATAMLAQANQLPQQVLSLLQ